MSLPTLVLLPGLDGTGLLFRPLLEALSPELPARVVTYPPDRELGYEALLERVLDALPADGPFILLGESFSGPLALMAAARRPAGLVGVVLCASFHRCPHPYVPGWLGCLVRPWLLRIVPRFSQVKGLLGCYATPALRVLVREALALVAPEVFACRLRAVLMVDVAADLAGCPVPLLYLRGSRDWVVPFWNAKRVRRVLPTADIRVIPSPHMVLQTQAQLACDALLSFAHDVDQGSLEKAPDRGASGC